MSLALVNRIGNTIGLPVRIGGTAIHGSLDLLNILATYPKQVGEIVSDTTKQIKDVLSSGWNDGKWYRRARRGPTSLLVSAGTLIEGLGRAVINPSWNAVLHTKDVLGNFLVNPGNAIKSILSDKPVSDFRYEHLATEGISKKNWFSNLFIGGKKDSKDSTA